MKKFPITKLSRSRIQQKLSDKFKIDQITGCWNWINYKSPTGYGVIKYGKHHTYRVHRLMYFLWFSDFKDDMVVCHKCDNPSCINPEHLFLGTQLDNIRDRNLKGRTSRLGAPIGSRNGGAKLTDENVKYIRKSKLSVIDLANKFSVSDTTISNVLNRVSWRHI